MDDFLRKLRAVSVKAIEFEKKLPITKNTRQKNNIFKINLVFSQVTDRGLNDQQSNSYFF